MKKLLFVTALSFVFFCAEAANPKYIFYMIGDGLGINQAFAAENYNKATGGPEVNFLHFPVRTFVGTAPSDGFVTDSAAAGSALATGQKVKNWTLSVSAEGEPLSSLADWAGKAGYATGVASTAYLGDATLSVFYASEKNRGDFDSICRQMIDSQIDFFAASNIPQQWQSDKTPEYWEQEIRNAGITVVKGRGEYRRIKGRMLMLPAARENNSIPYAIDRRGDETCLADYTRAAIDHLYNSSSKGFFVMIESSKIDYASHANDAAALIHEVNDFCVSIDIVLDFYAKHPGETLIIVTGDHETGGLTLGDMHYAQNPQLLSGQKISEDNLTSKLRALQQRGDYVGWPEVKELLRSEMGLWDTVEVTPEENKVLSDFYKKTFIDGEILTEENLKSTNYAFAAEVVRYIDRKAGYGFRINTHSGAPLGLYVKGVGASEFVGCRENSDIPNVVAKIAGFRK